MTQRAQQEDKIVTIIDGSQLHRKAASHRHESWNLADNLTIQAKNLAENKASNSAMTAVVGGLIGVLEAHNISITKELDEMFSEMHQRITNMSNNSEPPKSEVVQYFLECYLKELNNIQVQRNTSRTRAEERLKEKSTPEA